MRVIFRTDKESGEVTAVFPEERYSPQIPALMVCYAHVGQHSGCSPTWMKERTRAAKRKEYAPLLAELRGIYGDDLDAGTRR